MENKLKELFKNILFVFIGIALVSLFWKNILILTTLLAMIWGVIIYFRHNDTLYLFIGGIIGSGSEIVLVYFGAWSYASSTFLGIPLYLPFVWGLAVIVIKNIVNLIKK